ncbi:aminoglycoside N-acetyltransferase AAC(2')-Ie [Kineococcus sp. NUM-3379]
MVPDVVTVHTASLDAGALGAVRALLEAAFGGDLAAEDVEHALGGLHVLVREEGDLVAHGALVQRRVLHRGRALRCGYVEAVAVRPDRRRRGHAAQVMTEVERVARRAYDLGALSASGAGADLYLRRGWLPWRGPTAVLAPDGLRRTPGEDGSVYVLPAAAELDLDVGLACDWRDGDVW